MQLFNTTDGVRKTTRRIRYVSTIFVSLLIYSFASTAFAQNLVVNGGFEEPDLSSFIPDGHPAQWWETFYGQNFSGPADCPTDNQPDHCNDGMVVPGWSVIWTDDGTPGRLEIQRGPVAGVLPAVGDQKAELDTHHRIGNNNNNVTLLQELNNTCVGGGYLLTYQWYPRTGIPGDNSMSVRLNNETVAVHNSNSNDITTWQSEEIPFLATSTTTLLEFRSWGDNTTFGVFLDDISVVEDPFGPQCEPPVPPSCDLPDDVCYAIDGTYLGRPRLLKVSYDADADSAYTQDPGEVIISPSSPAYPASVTIRAFDTKGKQLSLLNGDLSPAIDNKVTGGIDLDFAVSGGTPNGKIPPKIVFEIRDAGTGDLVQSIQFHSSCSQPLAMGDEFGAITIEGALH